LWDFKPLFFQPLVPKAKATPLPVENFELVIRFVEKYIKSPSVGLKVEALRHDDREPIDRASHINGRRIEKDLKTLNLKHIKMPQLQGGDVKSAHQSLAAQ
jgi:hypothetical protein